MTERPEPSASTEPEPREVTENEGFPSTLSKLEFFKHMRLERANVERGTPWQGLPLSVEKDPPIQAGKLTRSGGSSF